MTAPRRPSPLTTGILRPKPVEAPEPDAPTGAMRLLTAGGEGSGAVFKVLLVATPGLAVGLVLAGFRELAVPLLLAPPLLVTTMRRRDAVSMLTLHLVLLFMLPSVLIIGPLGASGTPANVGAIGLFAWWALSRLVPSLGSARTHQPIHVFVLLWGMALFCSYAAAFLRPFDGLEATAADRGVLVLLGGAGLSLIIADGIANRERLEVYLRRLVHGAAFLAFLGLLQFFLGIDLAGFIQVPGLTANAGFGEIAQRSIFRRVQGTSSHPIEFAVALAAVLPVAVHFGLHTKGAGEKLSRVEMIVILMALPMSVSRSGIVGMLVGLLCLFAVWDRPVRIRMLKFGAMFAVIMRLLIPGLMGTILSLFKNIQNDPSTTGRTDDYEIVGSFVLQRPWFGRGFFTFLPDYYITLDNQYLLTVIEMGFVGLACLFLLFLGGFFTARGARRRSVSDTYRHLCQAIAGGILALMFTFVTFDALSFPMVNALTFMMVGAAGAAWRIARQDPATQVPDDERSPVSNSDGGLADDRTWVPRDLPVGLLPVVDRIGSLVGSRRPGRATGDGGPDGSGPGRDPTTRP